MYNHDAQEIKLAKHPAIQKRHKAATGDMMLCEGQVWLVIAKRPAPYKRSVEYHRPKYELAVVNDVGENKTLLEGEGQWLPVQWQAERMLRELADELRISIWQPQGWDTHQWETDAEAWGDATVFKRYAEDEGAAVSAPTTLAAMLKMVIELEESHVD